MRKTRVTTRISGSTAKGDQRQPPVHAQHDGDNQNQNENVLEDGKDARGKHLVQRVHIAGQPGHQAPHRIAVKEADVHPLDVAEDLAAHVEHDLLSGPLHQVGLHELQQVAEHQRGQVDARNLGNAHHGIGTQPPGQRRRMGRRPRGHVAIHSDFGQVGAEHIRAGLEQDRHQRNNRLQLVGPKVGQQSPHQPAVISLAHNVVVVLLGFPVLLRLLLGHGLVSFYVDTRNAVVKGGCQNR